MGALRVAVDLVVARETRKGDCAICSSAAFEDGVAQEVQVSGGDQHLPASDGFYYGKSTATFRAILAKIQPVDEHD